MGLFSADFRAECQKGASISGSPAPGAPEIYPILELGLPSGTRLYSSPGVPSVAHGHSEARIIKWGSITRAVELRGTNLQSVEVSPELSDIPDDGTTLRVFASEVARYPRSLRGSAATIRLVSPNVADADSFVAFSGVLKGWEQRSAFSWLLKLGPDDSVLEFGQAPKATIQPVDWPQADPSAYGTFIPIIYGIHNSDSLSPRAMLPTYYVDTAGFRYLVSLGRMSQIRAVYKDGSVVSTSLYAVTQQTINGKTVTLIDFTSDQGADAVITVDGDGLTANSDGTGGLITNPASQLLHLLVNFVWGDWRSGDFLPTASAPLNTDTFTAVGDFLDQMGHEGSFWLGGAANAEGVATSRGARDILEEWLASHECRAFWTNAGQLALGVSDHRTIAVYIDDPHLQGNIDELGDFATPFDAQSVLREITMQYVYGQVAGKYHQTVRVQDLSVDDPIAKTRQLPWSAARIV